VSDLVFYERVPGPGGSGPAADVAPDADVSWYRPSRHAQGAWRPDEQHMSPIAGLLADAVERHAPRPDLQVARIGYDILGSVPLAECAVAVRTLRPGRTIELIEAVLYGAGRSVVRATAWRLTRQDTAAVAGGAPEPLPPPEAFPVWPGTEVWDGGYLACVEIRRAGDAEPGRGRAWIRSAVDLYAPAEQVAPTAGFLRLVDTANGIVVRQSPRRWLFPNVDLTVHLFRRPVGEWLGLDTTVVFGAEGLGVTTSWLHDVTGPVGRVEQALTVRPMPASR
jgi:hypothetical protein